MKKIFAMAVALIAAVSVNAQDLTDNYQKVYAGFQTWNFFDAKNDAYKGFNIGYAYAFNITGHRAPLFLEVGAEYSYLSLDQDGLKVKDNSLQIPVNVTYKFGNEKFTVAPFIGEALRIHMSTKSGDVNVFDLTKDKDGVEFNRLQAAFNVGVNFTIAQHFMIGYRCQISETTFEKELKFDGYKNDPKNDYAHNITVGFVF